MFTLIKFTFKFMSALAGIFLLLLILILYRGGEDFRWVGKITQDLGRSIAEVGDVADKALELRKNIMGSSGDLKVIKGDIKKEVNKTKPSHPKEDSKAEPQKPVEVKGPQ